MNHSFAVVFVVITTMAAAGVWAVVRWLSDIFSVPHSSSIRRCRTRHRGSIMWDFVAATIAGMVPGWCSRTTSAGRLESHLCPRGGRGAMRSETSSALSNRDIVQRVCEGLRGSHRPIRSRYRGQLGSSSFGVRRHPRTGGTRPGRNDAVPSEPLGRIPCRHSRVGAVGLPGSEGFLRGLW